MPASGGEVSHLESLLPLRFVPRSTGQIAWAFGSGFADIDIMRSQAEHLKRLFEKRRDCWDVYDSWGSPGYQMRVTVDEDAANLAGVTNAGVAQTLNAYFSGHYLTTYQIGRAHV